MSGCGGQPLLAVDAASRGAYATRLTFSAAFRLSFQVLAIKLFSDVADSALLANCLDLDLLNLVSVYTQGERSTLAHTQGYTYILLSCQGENARKLTFCRAASQFGPNPCD